MALGVGSHYGAISIYTLIIFIAILAVPLFGMYFHLAVWSDFNIIGRGRVKLIVVLGFITASVITAWGLYFFFSDPGDRIIHGPVTVTGLLIFANLYLLRQKRRARGGWG